MKAQRSGDHYILHCKTPKGEEKPFMRIPINELHEFIFNFHIPNKKEDDDCQTVQVAGFREGKPVQDLRLND